MLLIVFSVMAYSSYGRAQVTISGLSGEVAQDAVVTIQGSGFGSKIPAAPLKYDSFQQGQSGQTIDQGSPEWNLWSDCQPSRNPEAYYPQYSTDRSRFQGDVAARQWFGPTSDGYVSNCTIGLTDLEIGKLYVSGWIFHERSLSGPESGARNVKIWQNCVGVWGAPTTRYDCYPMNSDNSGHIYTETCGTHVESNIWGVGMPSADTWHRLEIYHDRGAAGRDELMTVVEDNQLVSSFSNAYSGCNQDRLYLMSYHDQNNGNGAEMAWYWGEIYVDVTQARVEIGDAETLNACTHKEIQIPEMWSDQSITIKVNQGSFQSGDNLFLFVLDEYGNVNDSGFPLTMNDEFHNADGPGEPGQPIRQ